MNPSEISFLIMAGPTLVLFLAAMIGVMK